MKKESEKYAVLQKELGEGNEEETL